MTTIATHLGNSEAGYFSNSISTDSRALGSAKGSLLQGLAVVLAMVFFVAGAGADAIKVGGFWYEGAAFETYESEHLNYVYNGNPNKVYLPKIEAVKMQAYPQLEEAEKAERAKKPKEMLAAMKIARSKAQEPWLRIWLDGRMYPLMAKEGEHLNAVNAFIALVENKAPVGFLEDVPAKNVAALSRDDKKRLREKLVALRKGPNVKDKTPLADALDEMIENADPGADPVPVKTPGTNTTPDTGDGVESVIPLPEFMLSNKPDAITKLLARGRFDQALDRVKEELATAAGGGKTSLLLYQRGVAMYYQALALDKEGKRTQAEALLKEAGLSFMRVPIYFKTSPYIGPSLLESAAVHIKLKRPDIARSLLEQAGAAIDPDDKPLKARFDHLNEELSKQ